MYYVPTISERKQIPRFSCMRKQSIPGRLSPPTRPRYEATSGCLPMRVLTIACSLMSGHC